MGEGEGSTVGSGMLEDLLKVEEASKLGWRRVERRVGGEWVVDLLRTKDSREVGR